MDCEKFDKVMLDELYGELDEVTSAAAKRHLSGCARCSSVFAGLKATRRVALLPLVDPPEDLADRILAKTWEAQKVVPIKSRFTRFVSVAGSWAMRPQTAMAAVFLLMIGSSVIYMSGRSVHQQATQSASQSFGGSPAIVAPEDKEQQRLDYASAASAHGTEPMKQLLPMATATATAGPAEIANNLDPNAQGGQNGFERNAPGAGGGGGALAFGDDGIGNASAPAAGAMQQAAPTVAAKGAQPPPATIAPYGKEESKDKDSTDLKRGIGQYNDKKYDEATKTLDALTGSAEAALWAARSVRDSKGCAAAVQRFDDITTRQWGTIAGYEAAFDAGRCYEAMGRLDLARARYSKMLSVPQYSARAQNELDRIKPISTKAAPAPRSMDNEKNAY
jgi:hypothetical protein